MKFLRKIANKTRRDHIQNETIRDMVGVKQITDFFKDRQKIKWFIHLLCMPTSKPALQAYNNPDSGARPQRRPRTKWMDNVTSILKSNRPSLADAMTKAKDRELFLPTTS